MREIPDRISPWEEGLTERELVILDAVGEGSGRSTVEIIQALKVPKELHTHQLREAIIGRLVDLEGKGLLRRIHARGERPTTWALTSRGRRVG